LEHTISGVKSSIKATPKTSKISGVKPEPKIKKSAPESSFAKPASPRTAMQSIAYNDSYRSNRGDISDTSMPLSTRSDVSSDNTLTGRSPSRSDESGQGHDEGLDNKRPGRKTPTDLLVEEIMGEGMILSPFNSGK